MYDLEFIQENHQIKNSDQKLDSPQTEDHVTWQQSPQRQSPEEENAARRHIPKIEAVLADS
jgi:hypothetical protein